MSQEPNVRGEKWKAFAISFAVTFFVVALMALVTVYWLAPPTPTVPQDPLGDGAYLPTTEDDFTMLVVGEDTDSGTLTFVLVGFFPTRGNMPVAVLPRDTLMIGKNKSDTLQGIYRTGGAAYAKAAVESVFGLSIDRWAAVDVPGFVKVTDLVGVTDFKLPVELMGVEGMAEMAAGMQRLDGARAAQIITFASYPGGELQRCGLSAQLICTMINTHLPLVESPASDPVFNAAVDTADTDLSQVDYQQRKEAAAFMARLEISPSQPLVLTGRYNAAGNTFSPDEASLKALQSAFSRAE